MAGDTTAEKISLTGDWTIDSISEQQRQLGEMNMPQGNAEGRPVEIDVAGIANLDASGCQLLAIWLKHLKAVQLLPRLVNMNDDLKTYASSLGFASEFMVENQQDGSN